VGILLAGYLPGEDRQGVSALETRLLSEPDLRLVIVGVITQHSLTTPRDDSDRDPTLTLKWQSVEPLTDPNDIATVEALLARVRSDRLGQDELPGVADAAMESAPQPARGRSRRRGALRPVTT
jgi:hypothetical protein